MIQNGNFLAEAVAACHTAAKSLRAHVETKTIIRAANQFQRHAISKKGIKSYYSSIPGLQ